MTAPNPNQRPGYNPNFDPSRPMEAVIPPEVNVILPPEVVKDHSLALERSLHTLADVDSQEAPFRERATSWLEAESPRNPGETDQDYAQRIDVEFNMLYGHNADFQRFGAQREQAIQTIWGIAGSGNTEQVVTWLEQKLHGQKNLQAIAARRSDTTLAKYARSQEDTTDQELSYDALTREQAATAHLANADTEKREIAEADASTSYAETQAQRIVNSEEQRRAFAQQRDIMNSHHSVAVLLTEISASRETQLRAGWDLVDNVEGDLNGWDVGAENANEEAIRFRHQQLTDVLDNGGLSRSDPERAALVERANRLGFRLEERGRMEDLLLQGDRHPNTYFVADGGIVTPSGVLYRDGSASRTEEVNGSRIIVRRNADGSLWEQTEENTPVLPIPRQYWQEKPEAQPVDRAELQRARIDHEADWTPQAVEELFDLNDQEAYYLQTEIDTITGQIYALEQEFQGREEHIAQLTDTIDDLTKQLATPLDPDLRAKLERDNHLAQTEKIKAVQDHEAKRAQHEADVTAKVQEQLSWKAALSSILYAQSRLEIGAVMATVPGEEQAAPNPESQLNNDGTVTQRNFELHGINGEWRIWPDGFSQNLNTGAFHDPDGRIAVTGRR